MSVCESDVLDAGTSATWDGPTVAGEWIVLHVKSRQEKTMSDELTARRIGHFLPLVTQVRYYGKRKFTVKTPLFPGYVFLHGVLEDAYTANRTKRIAQILRVPDQKRLDTELRSLHIAISQQAAMDPHPFLHEGIPVEVRAGPFRGVRGLIERRSSRNRLVLQVGILGEGASLEIDGSLLEPIE